MGCIYLNIIIRIVSTSDTANRVRKENNRQFFYNKTADLLPINYIDRLRYISVKIILYYLN